MTLGLESLSTLYNTVVFTAPRDWAIEVGEVTLLDPRHAPFRGRGVTD